MVVTGWSAVPTRDIDDPPGKTGGWASKKGGDAMLGWAIAFLIIALIAALLGFGGVAGAAAGIAKIIFLVFLIAFVLALVF